MSSELVWAIETEKLKKFEGFKKDENGDLYNFLSQNGLFLPRDFLETNDKYKQVIPQGLILLNDSVLLNKRLPGQSEARLNNTISLGFGGHLNPEDNILKHMDLIHIGLHRELAEEVTLPIPFKLEYFGLTNSEATDVSRKHIGVWFKITVLNDSVMVNEKNKLSCEWCSVNQLHNYENKFESWASFIYKEIVSKVVVK